MKTTLFLIGLWLPTLVWAQDAVQYGYDAAGNRISREVVQLRTGGAAGSAVQTNSQTALDSVWGVQQALEESLRIELYPNPTQGRVHLFLSDAQTQIEELRLLNQQGKQLYREKNLTGEQVLDLQAQAAGTYFVWVAIHGKIHRFQVVKH